LKLQVQINYILPEEANRNYVNWVKTGSTLNTCYTSLMSEFEKWLFHISQSHLSSWQCALRI